MNPEKRESKQARTVRPIARQRGGVNSKVGMKELVGYGKASIKSGLILGPYWLFRG